MEALSNQEMDQLFKSAPGGNVKLAFDDSLTILYQSEAFYSLIKNVADKTMGKAPLTLIKIAYSADVINLTQQIATQRQRKDNMISISFRTLQHDGSFKWIMVSGNKMDETWQSGTKTVPVYSCIAMDVTDCMMNYRRLEQLNDYKNKIAELSKDMYFEYDIAKDLLTFSEVFREVFGKDNVLPGFRKRLENTTMIHPEEHLAVISIYNSIMSGRKLARFEVRLIARDGTVNWYLCYATIIFDENKNPFKVVGKLAATNHLSNSSEKTTEQESYIPRLDGLTNVCTKESAQCMIAEAAKNQGSDVLSALFIIDIRNFKGINNIRKAIDGENILTAIGNILKKNFRTSDILGRMSLSEFVVYMKGVPSDNTVYEMAEKLCKDIEGLFSYSYSQHGLSVSMGITMHKGSQDFQQLMANANTALVLAKKVPMSSFEVFSGTI